MGEYATYKGNDIKIGTCEDMYYLRADQIGMVESDTLRDLTQLRFRFPFPDEDNVKPGDFDPYNRAAAVHGIEPPAEVEHHRVQFVAHAGFNVMLPCPLSADGKAFPFTMHANGFAGPVRIVQQRIWAGAWVLVCECGACHAVYRLPTLADAQPVLEAIEREAMRAPHGAVQWWRTIAERIVTGYNTAAPDAS